MPSPPCKPLGDVYGYGDITGDGNVSATDSMFIAQYLEGTRTLTPAQLIRADVNGDGKVNTLDQTLITDYAVGAITTFPVCTAAPVDLEWVRTHYDVITRDCLIDMSELFKATDDLAAGKITREQFDAVSDAYTKQTYLCVETPAKGEIVYPNYPTTAMVGASITVECRVKNTGGSSGTFKLALYKGTARVTQTSTWNQGAGTTTGIKRLNTTVPSTGTNVSYVLKCIRVT